MAAYTRNPQTEPDDSPGGSTVRQGVKDQNSQAINDLYVDLNAHSNNEDGLSHAQIDTKLTEIDDPVTGIVPRAEAARDAAEASASEAADSAAAAAVSETNAANSAVSAENEADRAEAEADRAQEAADFLALPVALPETQPSYALDSTTGLIEEVVVRASEQTYTTPSGNIATAPANTLRSSYKDGKFGLEIFEARENIVTYSEDASNGVWGKGGSTVAQNNVAAPNGEMSADLLIENTDTGLHSVTRSNITLNAETMYIFSVYLKVPPTNGRPYGRLRFATNAGFVSDITYNLEDGTVNKSNGSIEKYQNGWYRVSLEATTQTGATATSGVGVYMWDTETGGSGGGDGYIGDGVSGIYVWGAQLEEGSNISPYIPTEATAATRAASEVSADSSQFLNKSEGTFVIDVGYSAVESDKLPIALGTQFNGALWIQLNSTSALFSNRSLGGITNSASRVLSSGFNRIAASYSPTELKLSINGSDITSRLNTLENSVWDALHIGGNSWGDAGNHLNDPIYSITYYPKALSDTELIALSSK